MPPARTTKRTTTAVKIVNLDEILGDTIDTSPSKPIPFQLFGETFHADGNFNVIRLIQEDSDLGVEDQLRYLIVEKDRERFMSTLAAQPRLGTKAISAIINEVTGMVAGRPTT